jgi:exodeoxyribonuclease-3
MIKISTFNVNSVKARLPRLIDWLKNSKPHIVLLQEIKCIEQDFPFEAFEELGYNAVVYGQKTYNGVAILSKFRIEDVVKGLPNYSDNSFIDDQARYIEALIPIDDKAIRVASIYVPNGGGELSEGDELEKSQKFIYKLNFFDRLQTHLEKLNSFDEMQVFGGDFNVANQPIDTFNTKEKADNLLCNSITRNKFRKILNLGLFDSFRIFNPNSQSFSWWDYRGNSWQYNKGFRIDYLLTSPKITDQINNVFIEDKGVRDQEKASDHCPVSLNFS